MLLETITSQISMKMKKKKNFVKIQKSEIFKNRKIWSGNMVESYFPQNVTLICYTVSEKTRFTVDGRLRHGINSADTVKQS